MFNRKESAFDRIVKPVNYQKIKEAKYSASQNFIYEKLKEAEEKANSIEAQLKLDNEHLQGISPDNENRVAERAYLIGNIEQRKAALATCKETIDCYKTAYDALNIKK